MKASSNPHPTRLFPSLVTVSVVPIILSVALLAEALTLLRIVLCLIALLLHILAVRFSMNDGPREQDHGLDEQLIQAQKLAAVGEIATGIAHELNNPLAIIHQEVQWTQHCLANPAEGSMEEVTESLNEVLRQVGRCREITHRLLDFARKREPVLQRAELNEILEEMVRLVESTARLALRQAAESDSPSPSVTIERRYAPSLPPVRTDVPLLRQVVLNLLTNAVQALGDRGGVVTVASMSPDSKTVCFSISDTGCGIAPENLHHIFLPFFTTKPPGQGTGLGLAISYRIVHSLGGTIEVESEEGKGSRFTVTLPVAQEVKT